MVEKYIRELRSYLKSLNPMERAEASRFYEEYILDAKLTSRKEIEHELGTPKQLARKILAQYSPMETEPFLDSKKAQNKNTKQNLRAIWRILLKLGSIPIGIPLAIIMIVFMVIVFAAFLAIIISSILLIAASIGIGILLLPIVFTNDWAAGIFYLGWCLIVFALILMLEPLDVSLFHWLVNFVANLVRTIGYYFLKMNKHDPDFIKEIIDRKDYQ